MESEWNHFTTKWQCYWRLALTKASNQHIFYQLQACCSMTLEKIIWKTGAMSNDDTEADLLKTMKRIAVERQHVLLNATRFLDIGKIKHKPADHSAAHLQRQEKTSSLSLNLNASQTMDSFVPLNTTAALRSTGKNHLERGSLPGPLIP
jgi:hypothetical protein